MYLKYCDRSAYSFLRRILILYERDEPQATLSTFELFQRLKDHQSTACIVLVVEDDPLVPLAAVDLILGAKWKVLQAATADEAILVLDAHPEITVSSPMSTCRDRCTASGWLRLRRRVWPSSWFIVASGHVCPGDRLAKDATFFAKPYSPAAIRAAIREAASF